MADDFSLSDIKKIAGGEELLAGNFGIEVEGLRVTHDGKLSLRPHPSIFGNKLTNPYITTDFSESQVEIITPTSCLIWLMFPWTRMNICGSSHCLAYFLNPQTFQLPDMRGMKRLRSQWITEKVLQKNTALENN